MANSKGLKKAWSLTKERFDTMPLIYATTFPVPQELPGEFDSTAADRDSIEARIRVLRTYVLNATTADLHCDVFDAAWEMADLHETLEGMS